MEKPDMHEPNIVILAGGISSRMKRSAGSALGLDKSLQHDAAEKSKSMIGVGTGHRPFLDYLLYNVQAAGYRDAVLLIGQNDSAIREYYDGRGRPGVLSQLNFHYVVQPIPDGRTKPLGTADALLRSLEARPDWKGKQFTVCNSDNLYTPETLKLLLESEDRNALVDYAFEALRFPQERIFQFAILKKDSAGWLTDILEKPTEEELRSAGGAKGVSMNIFRFTFEDILPSLKEVPLHPTRNEKELPQAVRMLVQRQPRSVRTFPRSEYVPDLTTVNDIPEVQKYIAEQFSGITF